MATKSKVVERSFRFGSGRYIQESGAAARLGEEILRLGCKRAYILGGKTAFSLVLDTLKKSMDEKGIAYEIAEYRGFCCVATCERHMATPAFAACDVVVAVGGGNVCDAAKLMAVRASRPVITVPTSAATCACFTPLSVTYTEDFRCAGSIHHPVEVNAVLADLDVLCHQPERLLAAGVYDAAAKLIEIEQRVMGMTKEDMDVGLACSYALSHHTYERMFACFDGAVAALKAGECNKELSDLIYLSLAATGVISGMARGSNQCAIAHKVYELSRTLFPETVKDVLHGEMVAIGLLVQLYYNGRENEVEDFRAGLRSHGLPVTLAEVGIVTSDENIDALYEKLLASTAMAGTSPEEQARLKIALEVIR